MQTNLVQPEVVAKWNDTYAKGSDKNDPNSFTINHHSIIRIRLNASA